VVFLAEELRPGVPQLGAAVDTNVDIVVSSATKTGAATLAIRSAAAAAATAAASAFGEWRYAHSVAAAVVLLHQSPAERRAGKAGGMSFAKKARAHNLV
jgi:hypothetical protein